MYVERSLASNGLMKLPQLKELFTKDLLGNMLTSLAQAMPGHGHLTEDRFIIKCSPSYVI